MNMKLMTMCIKTIPETPESEKDLKKSKMKSKDKPILLRPDLEFSYYNSFEDLDSAKPPPIHMLPRNPFPNFPNFFPALVWPTDWSRLTDPETSASQIAAISKPSNPPKALETLPSSYISPYKSSVKCQACVQDGLDCSKDMPQCAQCWISGWRCVCVYPKPPPIRQKTGKSM
jgi:hypothetical protein